MKNPSIKGLLILGVAGLPMLAHADRVNVKPGLWETTTKTDMGGAPMPAIPTIPPEVLAKMPPEQRARMEAMMAKRGPGGAITNRSCVTEKDLERGLTPEPNKEQECKVDSVKTTATTQEAHITCTSEHGTSSGVFKMTATSRESFDGVMDMDINVENRPMKMKMTIKGKWLGANCGDVKPRDATNDRK